jgi:hypothetical protein
MADSESMGTRNLLQAQTSLRLASRETRVLGRVDRRSDGIGQNVITRHLGI